MALLIPKYTAPLPAGFVSGTIEIKYRSTYIDAAGRKAQAYYKAQIQSNRTLIDVQTGGVLTIVAAGMGDPNPPLLDWTESLTISGIASAQRLTREIPGIYTAPGEIDLHKPNENAPLVAAPNDAASAAQLAAERAEAARAATETAANVLQGEFVVVVDQVPGQSITLRSSRADRLVGSLEVLTVGGRTYSVPVVDADFGPTS